MEKRTSNYLQPPAHTLEQNSQPSFLENIQRKTNQFRARRTNSVAVVCQTEFNLIS